MTPPPGWRREDAFDWRGTEHGISVAVPERWTWTSPTGSVTVRVCVSVGDDGQPRTSAPSVLGTGSFWLVAADLLLAAQAQEQLARHLTTAEQVAA